MTEVRRAVVVAPGSTLQVAAANALTPLGFDVSPLAPSEVVSDALEAVGAAEACILILGDEIFPDHPDPDLVLREGMRRVFIATKLAARGMLRRREGCLIAVAPAPHSLVARQAAVGSLAGFMKSVAREVGSRGITANVVAPGTTEEAGLSPYTALGRPMAPADLSAAIAFLASPDGAYFTGQVMAVDGGLGQA